MDISRESYSKLPIDNKMDIVFDLLTENKQDHEAIKVDVAKCNVQIVNRKKVDTTVAGLMGLAGGFIGFLTNKILFK